MLFKQKRETCLCKDMKDLAGLGKPSYKATLIGEEHSRQVRWLEYGWRIIKGGHTFLKKWGERGERIWALGGSADPLSR